MTIKIVSEELDRIMDVLKKIEEKIGSGDNNNEEYITTEVAAKLLSCDKQTIRNMEKAGKLKRYVHKRIVRFKKNDVMNCLDYADRPQ